MQHYATSSTDVNKHHIRVQILKLALPNAFPTVVRRQYQFSFHQVVKLEPTNRMEGVIVSVENGSGGQRRQHDSKCRG